MRGASRRYSADQEPRVGVNLLWLVPGVVGGSEEYTTRLLAGLAETSGARLDLTLFVLRPFASAHPDLAAHYRTVVVPLAGRAKPARVAAESTWLAAQVRRRKIDVVHHAGGTMPALRTAPGVLTIHDLQPLVHPEHFSAVKRTFSRLSVPRSARAARLVLTPSEFSRSDVIARLGVPGDNVVVVPHGIAPGSASPASMDVRARHRLPGPFFLYPAITYPHKNHLVLIEAFAAVAAERPDVSLVLTGGPGPTEAAVADRVSAMGIGPRVRRLGRVHRAELDSLLQEATALTFPSSFEGFGAPVLEAMGAGCPVVAADATALPEVVGDAGLLVPPNRPDDWSRAMRQVLDDGGLRDRLAAAGRSRAAGYRWDRSARCLADAYRRALEPGRS